jgi:DNA-binding helix-hairpin-helix protein with protein kinase domain
MKKTVASPPVKPRRPAERLRTNKGEEVSLGRRIAGGGEGNIYEIAGSGQKVAKIYHPTRRTPDREAKLKVMLVRPPRDDTQTKYNHKSIAWPERIIYSNGQFAGYWMPRITDSWPLIEIYNPSLRSQRANSSNWRFLHHAAVNLARAVNVLHIWRYVVGDLNESNLLVNKDALITLVDTDSFQVRDEASRRIYYCRVGKPEFKPPELYGRPLDRTERHWYHDSFGLAVLIFMILMEGNHPFTGLPRSGAASPSLSYEDNIGRGIFPYDPASGYLPPKNAPAFSMLHPRLQAMFMRAFVTSRQGPAARPTARDWADALDETRAYLTSCHRNRNHVYSTHLRYCPWCEREARHSGLAGQIFTMPSPTPTPTPTSAPAPVTGSQQSPPSSKHYRAAFCARGNRDHLTGSGVLSLWLCIPMI